MARKRVVLGGVEYPSITAAAAAVGGTKKALQQAIVKQARKYRGLRLEVIEPDAPDPVEEKHFLPRVDDFLDRNARTHRGGLLSRTIVAQ